MGVTVADSALKSCGGQLRPFLPARPAVRQASRAGVRCRASSDEGERVAGSVDRRAALLGLLGLGFAADAQAVSNPLAQKKDPYTVKNPTAAFNWLHSLDGSFQTTCFLHDGLTITP